MTHTHTALIHYTTIYTLLSESQRKRKREKNENSPSFIDVDNAWSFVLFTRKQNGNLICLTNGDASDHE